MAAIDQLKRLFQLVHLLQEADAHSPDELADACGVSRRTIYRDFGRLEDLGVRVQRTNLGYRLRNVEDVGKLVRGKRRRRANPRRRTDSRRRARVQRGGASIRSRRSEKK